MRFLLDENVRAEIGAFLKTAGHDVVTTPRGVTDPKVFELAKTQSRILITHDAEFANILRYPPASHAGIIRLKFHPPSVGIMLRSLEALLHQVSAKAFTNTLFVLEKDGFRKRS